MLKLFCATLMIFGIASNVVRHKDYDECEGSVVCNGRDKFCSSELTPKTKTKSLKCMTVQQITKSCLDIEVLFVHASENFVTVKSKRDISLVFALTMEDGKWTWELYRRPFFNSVKKHFSFKPIFNQMLLMTRCRMCPHCTVIRVGDYGTTTTTTSTKTTTTATTSTTNNS